MHVPRRAVLLSLASAPFARAAEPASVVWPLAGEPKTLIPAISDDPGARWLGAKLYRGLMRWASDGTLQPDLARSVEPSADGLTTTLRLRPGVTWHDGGGFDAADVVFSLTRFHRALQPRLALDRLRITAPDPLTVNLTLPAPDPLLLRRLCALSLPIVPQHIHDVPGWGLNPRVTTPVGTGPFRFAGWLRLVRFEWFVGARPALASIDCPILPDPAARLALADGTRGVVLAGDAADLAAAARLRANAALAVEADLSPAAAAIAGLRLNPAATPLDQPQVRLALACAIDRAAMLRQVWAGLGRVATGPVWQGPALLPDYNPRVAAQHLTNAGVRPDAGGIRARLAYLHPPGAPWQTLFPVLSRALGQIGIELSAEPVSYPTWTSRISAGAYQITGFTEPQTGDPAVDLAQYGSGLPADQAAAVVAQMPALWLVEPAILVAHDKRLLLPSGVLGDLTDARWEE